jgi:hypothetical protein
MTIPSRRTLRGRGPLRGRSPPPAGPSIAAHRGADAPKRQLNIALLRRRFVAVIEQNIRAWVFTGGARRWRPPWVAGPPAASLVAARLAPRRTAPAPHPISGAQAARRPQPPAAAPTPPPTLPAALRTHVQA